jgi:hypothetical protein
MTLTETTRTLVKSPPELWAECSDPAALARHLGRLGEIRITKVEPESTVAWEGELASGTVRLEPSGWGTRVTLVARPAASATGPERPVAAPAPERSVDPPEPAAAGASGLKGMVRSLLRRRLTSAASPLAPMPALPDPAAPPGPVQAGGAAPEGDLEPILVAALDSLGRAHRRPFSRG